MTETIETRVISVNLEVAKEFLTHNRPPEVGVEGTNRKPSMKVVRSYARSMLLGEWILSPQGLSFNRKGNLIDGQHRMMALELAATEGVDDLAAQPDLTIPFLVAFNVPDEAMDTMDIGKRRMPHDFLTAMGVANSMMLSGLITPCFCYENVPWTGPYAWAEYRITPTQRKAYLTENPSLHEALIHGSSVKKIMKASAAGSLWFHADKQGLGEYADEFLNSLRSGALLDKGNPILTLRELMFNARSERRNYSVTEELALSIKAFNRWVQGGTYKSLAWRWDELFPRILTVEDLKGPEGS